MPPISPGLSIARWILTVPLTPVQFTFQRSHPPPLIKNETTVNPGRNICATCKNAIPMKSLGTSSPGGDRIGQAWKINFLRSGRSRVEIPLRWSTDLQATRYELGFRIAAVRHAANLENFPLGKTLVEVLFPFHFPRTVLRCYRQPARLFRRIVCDRVKFPRQDTSFGNRNFATNVPATARSDGKPSRK